MNILEKHGDKNINSVEDRLWEPMPRALVIDSGPPAGVRPILLFLSFIIVFFFPFSFFHFLIFSKMILLFFFLFFFGFFHFCGDFFDFSLFSGSSIFVCA